MYNIHHFSCNTFQELSYLVWDENGFAVIIDPGFFPEEIPGLLDFIEGHRLSPKAILMTHAHFDHSYAVKYLSDRFGLPVYLHPEDSVIIENAGYMAERMRMPVPDTSWSYLPIKEGDKLSFGLLSFEVIETPGHTPGSVCYHNPEEKLLFSGDCLFAGSIGMTSYEWGDYDKEIASIMDKLMSLDPDTDVLPGHGPSTTIGTELNTNPFLMPFNFKDPQTGMVTGFDD